MALPDTWHVRTRSRKCSITGDAFEEGQVIITALFPDPESSGYLRKDFLANSWKERDEEDDKPFSHWKTVFAPPPAADEVETVTKQSAEDLLRMMVEEDLEHTENTRYIMAVMLERQKLLRETDTQPTTGGILRIYEHRKTGEVFIIKDPDIPLAQVEEIQNEVMELLAPKAVPEVEDVAEEEAPAVQDAEDSEAEEKADDSEVEEGESVGEAEVEEEVEDEKE